MCYFFFETLERNVEEMFDEKKSKKIKIKKGRRNGDAEKLSSRRVFDFVPSIDGDQ